MAESERFSYHVTTSQTEFQNRSQIFVSGTGSSFSGVRKSSESGFFSFSKWAGLISIKKTLTIFWSFYLKIHKGGNGITPLWEVGRRAQYACYWHNLKVGVYKIKAVFTMSIDISDCKTFTTQTFTWTTFHTPWRWSPQTRPRRLARSCSWSTTPTSTLTGRRKKTQGWQVSNWVYLTEKHI